MKLPIGSTINDTLIHYYLIRLHVQIHCKHCNFLCHLCLYILVVLHVLVWAWTWTNNHRLAVVAAAAAAANEWWPTLNSRSLMSSTRKRRHSNELQLMPFQHNNNNNNTCSCLPMQLEDLVVFGSAINEPNSIIITTTSSMKICACLTKTKSITNHFSNHFAQS